MTFEKALEAMKQGKTVKRSSVDRKVEYFIRNDTGEITAVFYDRLNPFSRVAFYSCELLADDWEICEEPNKETEMTAERAVVALRDIRKMEEYSYTRGLSITEFIHAIEFAIESLENQNQPKTEKKCECKCNSGAVNLQEEMKETLSRKFFELDRIEKDSLAVSNMIEIYRLLFEVE